MKRKNKSELVLLIVLIIIGQLVFGLLSEKITTPTWENRIYATTGITHDGSDLSKLNEAAHYFGQTIIGWTKFPNFMKNLTQAVTLPAGSSINAHMQERQNIVFTVYTSEPIGMDKLVSVKDYIQGKLDEYNSINSTKFVLSNLDYEQIEMKKSYEYGALSALIVSLIVGFGIIFLKREFFV